MPRAMALLHDGDLRRHAAAQAEQVAAVEQRQRVAAQRQFDGQVAQPGSSAASRSAGARR
jgi:hypothetical protein